jgi:hypothetical protein
MKRSIGIGGVAALAFVFTSSLAAQTPPPSSSSSRQSESQTPITVTGCLQKADSMSGGATGTSGTATSSASGSERFVLANARMGSGSSGSAGTSGTSGTSGATTGGSSASGSTYALEGTASELSPHVGHEVEIRGRVESSSSSSSSSTPTTAGGTSSATSSSSSNQRLRVESVKMVSSSCSSK